MFGENFENKPITIENEISNFLGIHEDDWDRQVTVGVPLYQKLVQNNHPESTKVEAELRYVAQVMKNSGAGSTKEKEAMIHRIEEALKG